MQGRITFGVLIGLLFGISAILWSFWRGVLPAGSALGDNLSGHIWDANYGWSSMNSCNTAYDSLSYPATDNCWVYPWGMNVTFTTDADGAITGGEIDGFIWHDSLGWICIGQTCGSYVADCGSVSTLPGGTLAVTFGVPGAEGYDDWAGLSGWGRICAWGDSGRAAWLSFSCENTGSCASSEYGVFIDVDTYTLGDPRDLSGFDRGYAYNGYDIGARSYGVGFMEFNPALSLAHSVHFETVDGDIYAKTNINPQVPITTQSPQRFNATYLILTNGSLVNVTSEDDTLANYKQITESYLRSGEDLGFGDIPAAADPTTSKVYEGALGTLDVAGMIAGDYGTVQTVSAIVDTAPLNDMVYYIDGDLSIGAGLTFKKGTLAYPSGAGTIIVNGDLNISADITYESGAITLVEYAPSVAWIVLGDITIDPTVTNVAGSFFALGSGDDSTTCPSVSTAANGCGRFSTGSTDEQALTIRGMVMARQLNFQRLYTDALDNPAELIIYDARLSTNPPPGLIELNNMLPEFSESAPF